MNSSQKVAVAARSTASSTTKCKVDINNDIHTAVYLCDELRAAVAGQYVKNDSNELGLFNQITSNLKGSYGNRIYIKSGKFSRGVCFRFCPFCGEKLMSDQEAEMVKYQVEIALSNK
ncbi:hypothetical protein [Vibrio sp. Hal054]|uniref:hypothetical protein n=1 Tax=Vibrio sp. Hal054 TaxID=3035158 RepID=UPI00301CDE4F